MQGRLVKYRPSFRAWFALLDRGNSRKPRRKRAADFRWGAAEIQLLEARVLLSGSDLTAVAATNLVRSPAVVASTSPQAQAQAQSVPAGYTGTFTPTTIEQAYGISQITFNTANGTVKGDGTGSTIAIVDAYDDPNIASDLHAFDVALGLPDPPSFIKLNQSGQTTNLPAANAGWITEIALDVEWAHAIAPGAKIVLVEANSASFSDLMTAVNTASSYNGVDVVSMSWAGSEWSGETGLDSSFVTPSGHNGVTFIAAAGDYGAPPSYPAVSPNVLSVGGTTLTTDSSGNYISESAWSGSGGGISLFEAQPSYQNGVVTQTTTVRANPDVSYDADPSTGFGVYDTYNNGTAAPWGIYQWGGTSDAAPQWAALIAIADQGRQLAGEGSLDGPSQTLPMLYAMSASNFHDITAGTTDGSPAYSAAAGYDLVSGRGTPFANLVVAGLVGTSATTTSGPGLAGTSSMTYQATQAPTAIDPVITVSDSGSATLASATITLTNYVAGQDTLGFTNNNSSSFGNIAGVFSNGTLTLTSSGSTATLAQFQNALRAVTYSNSSATPNTTTRQVTFQVNDGTATSNTITSTITVSTAPVLAGTSSMTYQAGQTATAIDKAITVKDPSSATLASATITLTNYVAGQDTLAFTNNSSSSFGNIKGVFSGGKLTLTSAGSTATLAQFQTALRAVTYHNSSSNPNTTTRHVTFQVKAGSVVSNTIASTITVTKPSRRLGQRSDTGTLPNLAGLDGELAAFGVATSVPPQLPVAGGVGNSNSPAPVVVVPTTGSSGSAGPETTSLPADDMNYLQSFFDSLAGF